LRGAAGSAVSPTAIRSRGQSVLHPPRRSGAHGPGAIGPAELRLPGGLAAHDFLRTRTDGARVEVERFDTIRPRVTVETSPPSIDLLVECDDRVPLGRAAAKLERYDHFLSGWSASTRRYGSDSGVLPLVVFVCRDAERARSCAEAADGVLLACRARAGEHPCDWEYRGRERIVFVAERDIHEGVRSAFAVDPLPAAVRSSLTEGEASAEQPRTRVRELP
ncbi:MAG TPA: hypothetical protein VH025_04630, partial [Solirubrobacteraceae bacterium]|nr:hypothetical protein [Solirubrobacteraceae bacterium]